MNTKHEIDTHLKDLRDCFVSLCALCVANISETDELQFGVDEDASAAADAGLQHLGNLLDVDIPEIFYEHPPLVGWATEDSRVWEIAYNYQQKSRAA